MGSKKQSANSFEELNSDLHPLSAKPNMMTDAVNAALITKGDNQFILQNMPGNKLLGEKVEFSLSKDFTPISVKVLNNIAYIISFNKITGKGEIGTFPSPDYNQLFIDIDSDTTIENSANYYLPLLPKYSPLRNFLPTPLTAPVSLNKDSYYRSSFTTTAFNFQEETLLEMELQYSYDNSVNIIFTGDGVNPPRLINSRFILSKDGKKASIAERRQDKDTNTYTDLDDRFLATRLLKQSDKILDLEFKGLIDNGAHKAGSYKFYFRYTDTDGNLTDIIEESRLISIGYDDRGALSDKTIPKSIEFFLKNLDEKFSGIKVYYSLISGTVAPAPVIREITNIYSYPSNETELTIVILGSEEYTEINSDLLSLDYSSIELVKTMCQYNNKLALGNIATPIEDFEEFKTASLFIKVKERFKEMRLVDNDGKDVLYSDPKNVYYELGVWDAETYEIGVVWVLANGKGLSPVFPIRGADAYRESDDPEILSPTEYTGYGPFPYDPEYYNSNGFLRDGFGQIASSASVNFGAAAGDNNLGCYRTNNLTRKLYIEDGDKTEIRHLYIDLNEFLEEYPKSSKLIQEKTSGFFFVRKERKKDCEAQGYITNTAAVPLAIKNVGDYPTSADTFLKAESNILEWRPENGVDKSHHIIDLRSGAGIPVPIVDDTSPYKIKFIPSPGRILESNFHSGELEKQGGQVGTPIKKGASITTQGTSFPSAEESGKYAFYSADMLANPSYFASYFDNSNKYFKLGGQLKTKSIVNNSVNITPFLDADGNPSTNNYHYGQLYNFTYYNLFPAPGQSFRIATESQWGGSPNATGSFYPASHQSQKGYTYFNDGDQTAGKWVKINNKTIINHNIRIRVNPTGTPGAQFLEGVTVVFTFEDQLDLTTYRPTSQDFNGANKEWVVFDDFTQHSDPTNTKAKLINVVLKPTNNSLGYNLNEEFTLFDINNSANKNYINLGTEDVVDSNNNPTPGYSVAAFRLFMHIYEMTSSPAFPADEIELINGRTSPLPAISSTKVPSKFFNDPQSVSSPYFNIAPLGWSTKGEFTLPLFLNQSEQSVTFNDSNPIRFGSRRGVTPGVSGFITAAVSLRTDKDPNEGSYYALIEGNTQYADPVKKLEALNSDFQIKNNETFKFKGDYINSEKEAFSTNQFTANSDRNLYYSAVPQQTTDDFRDYDFKDIWGGNYPGTNASTVKARFFSVINTKFSDYVGMSVENNENVIYNFLKNQPLKPNGQFKNKSVFNTNIFKQNGYEVTGSDITDYIYRIQEIGFNLGHIVNVYNNPASPIRGGRENTWQTKYANTSFFEPYYACTKRFKWDDIYLDPVTNTPDMDNYVFFGNNPLTDGVGLKIAGDCFVNFTYKRISYPAGVGVDTATDPTIYEDFNKDTGLYSKGFVMPIITQNNYNLALRTFDNSSASENLLYNQPRKFFPLQDINQLRTSQQPESTGYNQGYNYTISDRRNFSLDDRAPAFNTRYQNRIIISNPDVTSAFANGYTNFTGLNFKDYEQQLGEITKLISFNNNCYCIFANGIGIAPINEREAISTQSGQPIYLDNAKTLGDTMQIISSEIGSTQQYSIIKTNQAVYGYDSVQNKIWQIGQRGFSIISDFTIESILLEHITRLKQYPTDFIVKTNFDSTIDNVIFTFLNYKDIRDWRENLLEFNFTNDPGGAGAPYNYPYTAGFTDNVEQVPSLIYADPDADIEDNLITREEYIARVNLSLEYTTLDPSKVSNDPLYGDYDLNWGGDFLDNMQDYDINSNYFPGQIIRLVDSTNFPQDERTVLRVYECISNAPGDAKWFQIKEINVQRNKVASLYFNEIANKWISKLTWNPIWTFNLNNELYSFNSLKENYKIWQHTTEKFCNFYGEQDKFIFEFVVVENPQIQKILDNLIFISNEVIPNRIIYTLLEDKKDLDNFSPSNSGYTELIKRRHETVPTVGWELGPNLSFSGDAAIHIKNTSREELERLKGGYIVYDNQIYIIGDIALNSPIDEFYLYILNENGNNISGPLPTGFKFNTIEFGIIKQNAEYVEDHLYIEVDKDSSKARVRDKAIKIKVIYEGYDYTTIQSVLSIFDYSFI